MEQTIGQRIKSSRQDLGMSQKELAELVHVSDRSVQAYESDEVVPYRVLRQLAEVLNKPTAWILHGDEAQESPGELAPLLREILVVLQDISGTLKAQQHIDVVSRLDHNR